LRSEKKSFTREKKSDKFNRICCQDLVEGTPTTTDNTKKEKELGIMKKEKRGGFE